MITIVLHPHPSLESAILHLLPQRLDFEEIKPVAANHISTPAVSAILLVNIHLVDMLPLKLLAKLFPWMDETMIVFSSLTIISHPELSLLSFMHDLNSFLLQRLVMRQF